MTYEEKFFSEAAVVLHRSCCRTGTPKNGRIPIDFCGNADLTMDTNGTVYVEKLHVPYTDCKTRRTIMGDKRKRILSPERFC